VPFERKRSVPAVPVGPTAVSDVGNADAGQADTTEPAGAAVRAGVDKSGAKAAVEADGYRRVTILGPGPAGVWRARGYRGNTEVPLVVAADGSVSME
jgi:hypothetical protein